MNQRYTTQGIVLSRTNFGEADRIITFLSSTHGKVRVMAKGVRRSQSKLAGGIELFSVSDLTLIVGRGEINTLVSSRLVKHYANLVKDIERSGAAYEFMRIINKATEQAAEPDYFELLRQAFEALDNFEIPLELCQLWFNLQLLKLAGHTPNLRTTVSGEKLAGQKFSFDLDGMAFVPSNGGKFKPEHIKLMRLTLGAASPKVINRVESGKQLSQDLQQLVEAMLKSHLRI